MYGASYRAGHERVIALVVDHEPDTIVPACPEWTTTDVVRHLAGISADLTNRVLDGFASDKWTATQVSSRRGLTLDEVITAWRTTIDGAVDVLDTIDAQGLADQLNSVLGPIPPSVIPAMAVSDILHHEFDLRNAFGDTSGRDLIEVHVAAGGHVRSLRPIFAAMGLPTIRIEASNTGQTWGIGRDQPVATASASSFELLRGIGGRRTRDEMLAWDWDGDGEPFVDSMVLPHLGMRTASLRE